MKYRNMIHNKAFTLIELMVVITLIAIITLASYLPYAHHQKKVLVKQWAREISQSLAEARNLAIHGLTTWSWNLNVALFFGSWATQIEYYTSTGALSLSTLPMADLLKVKQLPAWVQIDTIDSTNADYLVQYQRISWSGSIEPAVSGNQVDISLSYKGAVSPVLQKVVHYYTQSYITDY